MTEREALLRAVCENPDDDTPRLVLADWLQENGEGDRAEFIRLQIQLARGQFRPSEEGRLKGRLRKLEAHTSQWKLDVPPGEYFVFSRGFIDRVCLLDAAHVGPALAAAPITSMRVRGVVDLLAVLNVPLLPRLKSLDLKAAILRQEDVEAFLVRDWPNHPQQLEISLLAAPGDLRDRILARFKWVWIPPL